MIDPEVSAVSFHLPNGLLAAALSHKTSCGHSTGQCAVQGGVTSSRNVVSTAEELGFLLNVFFLSNLNCKSHKWQVPSVLNDVK